MLLHEKMRLQRKVSQLTYKQLRASSRKERVTKNIEKIQKRYAKLETNITNRAKFMQNQASMGLRNMFGLGANMVNLNPMGYSGMNDYANNAGIQQIIAHGFQQGAFSGSAFNSVEELQEFMSQGYHQETVQDDEGKTKQVWKDMNGNEVSDSDDISTKMAQCRQIQSMASNQYSMNQNLYQNAISNYQNNVSIWEEAAKEQLEMEQDAALAPLQEMETEWEMEEESMKVQLEDARARLDSIKQALSQGIKDSASTFGLG